jgi:DNA-binding response OmpR family regulator
MSNPLKRILVVDDDQDISMMLKMMLEFKGYKVSTAERSTDVQEIVLQQPINLIIMDMLLSGMNGTDICAQLKSVDATKHIPIMMISAHPNAKELCLNAGANNFLSKPFDMEEILSAISVLVK